MYQRLAIDVDRRVREAGQKAHLVMIGIVGRDLAPHLKALAPAWYLSRADPHPPVNSQTLCRVTEIIKLKIWAQSYKTFGRLFRHLTPLT